MQAAPIVVALDEFLDPLGQVLHITVVVGVDFFALQRLQKTFATGVVMRMSQPTHARHYLVLTNHLEVGSAGIPYTPIRVVNESRRRLPARNRLPQGAEGKPRLQRSVEGPAHNLPRKGIQDYCQINKLGLEPKVGDIRNPQLVSSADLQSACEVEVDFQFTALV